MAIGTMRVMKKNADQAVRYYKARCWWVDEEDLFQEAMLAQVKAHESFAPEKASARYADSTADLDFERYLWCAAYYAVRASVLKGSSPVSASHRLDVLKGLYRAPMEKVEGVADSAERAYYARQVIDRVVRLLGTDGAEFVLGLVIDGWTAQDIARIHNVPVSDVNRELNHMTDILMKDRTLHELWREGA